jgi:hypothetical protein
MPRIYTSASDPIDFCKRCFPDEQTADKRYANVGDGPDMRGNCYGYDEDHPDYSDTKYRCEICKRLLTDNDN